MTNHLAPILAFFLLCPCSLLAQGQTVGTLLNSPGAYDGYTLLDPMGTTTTYLINNCGEVVNSWSSDHLSGGACYLLEDGSLMRGCRVNGAFTGGGVGGRLERKSWDDELLWFLDWADDNKHHHHDFAWMPNGHVLVLAWELKTVEEVADAGRINPQVMWPESITEIAPASPSGGEVVWEWHAWDHLVQDSDPGLANYGTPSDYPHKIDVNYANVGGGGGPGGANSGDWTHANAVNYNPDLDQIAISSRRFSEIWIINHNTTSEEAAGEAGDLLYRYGNPEAYGRGTSSDRVLFGQHDVQWIPDGHPLQGQLIVYNNGEDRPECACSSIDVWQPPLLPDGTYELSETAPYGPSAWSWTYPDALNADFFSPNISGVQPLPNDNFLICQGADGTLFEVTPEGNTVWVYRNPEGSFGITPQGGNPQQNSVFRAYRYGPSYSAFDGKDLTPGEPLEGTSEFSCELFPQVDGLITPSHHHQAHAEIRVYPNPTSNQLSVTFPAYGNWEIVSTTGQIAKTGSSTDLSLELDVSMLNEGIWFLRFWSDSSHFSSIRRFVVVNN